MERSAPGDPFLDDPKYLEIINKYYNQTKKVIDDEGNTREIGYDCSVLKNQGEYLYNFARRIRPEHTLEIGLAWGGSAIHILCALDKNDRGHHTAIDPYQDGWSNIGIREPQRFGLGHRLTCVYEKSEAVLPRFLAENRKFQFIFIDGDHRFDGVMIDFFYCQKLLDIGGVMVFDDAGGHAIEMVTNFIDSNMHNLENLGFYHGRFAAYRKIDDDNRGIGYAIPFGPTPIKKKNALRRAVSAFFRPGRSNSNADT